MPYDSAIHSDFLIHWTGKDLDNEFDADWENRTNQMCFQQPTFAAGI